MPADPYDGVTVVSVADVRTGTIPLGICDECGSFDEPHSRRCYYLTNAYRRQVVAQARQFGEWIVVVGGMPHLVHPSSVDTRPAQQSPARPLARRQFRPRPVLPVLVDRDAVVHDYMLGVGYRPRTHFGIEVRDTTISGLPHRMPSIGPARPARISGGPVITGLSSHLYPRAQQRSPFA